METIPGARVRGSLVRRLYHADWFLAVEELESAVHWSDGYIMLIGFSLWT